MRVVDPSGRCRSATTSWRSPARPVGSRSSRTTSWWAGIGSQVELALREAGLTTPLDQVGIPKEFLDHGSRGQVLDRAGLTPDAVASRLRARLG